MRHSELSRAAKGRVNASGICCTMTIPGKSAGKGASSSFKASVPPVDDPIATTLCVAEKRKAGPVASRIAVDVELLWRSLARAAAFTLATISSA